MGLIILSFGSFGFIINLTTVSFVDFFNVFFLYVLFFGVAIPELFDLIFHFNPDCFINRCSRASSFCRFKAMNFLGSGVVGAFNLCVSIPTRKLHLTSDTTWLVIILKSLEVAEVFCYFNLVSRCR